MVTRMCVDVSGDAPVVGGRGDGDARLSRLGVAAPQVLDELAAGRIGVFQAGVLAKAYANLRVRDQLLGVLDGLLVHAANMPAHDFATVVDTWVKLVDADGSFDDRERARTPGRRLG